MKTLPHGLKSVLFTAALTVLPIVSQAGIFSFAEYDGTANNTAIPIATLPEGAPDGVTASWVGFRLHTTAGDTPMSVFPLGAQAVLAFLPPAIVNSINVQDTSAGDAVTIIGKLHGKEVWKYVSPGDHDWQKVTVGAGIAVDSVTFIGKNNYYDDLEVEAAPDTDGDGYVDADEDDTGHDKNDLNNNPTASALADSITQFGGVQGENNWFYGYRNYTTDGGGVNYDPTTAFIPFTEDLWRGGGWDMNTAAAAPWTELNARDLHPNTGAGAVHWVIRRWVADQITQVTPLAFRWHAHHGNITCGGNGITAGLYLNGQLLDGATIAGPDNVGVTHTFYVNAKAGDRFDLVLTPKGTDGIDADGCDGSQNWFLVDPTLPSTPVQPDGSIFVPAGTGDADADQLPDVWEKIYFPNDLTKLSATGDYDNDSLSDLGEYQRSSDPTKPDTDGDTLNDVVETATGNYVSKTDTGSNPTKQDTDGDGLTDDVEVNRAPATNPNKADTDTDGFSDPFEIDWGTNPTDPKDTPTTHVIANSEADFSGTQGQKGWYYGYRIFDPSSGATNYNATADFIRFPGGEGAGAWDGGTQIWTGDAWDLNTAAAGPWTFEAALDAHPNGANSPATIDGSADPANEQWVIRRWVASQLTKDTPATIIWRVRKTNLAGTGVSGLLFVNGQLIDSKAIEGTDGTGEIRRAKVTLKANDMIDLALTPTGPSGDGHDGNDGSQTWFWVDTRPTAPTTPTLSMIQTATGLTLTFTGTLQTADKVQGPYTDVGTTSPINVLFSAGLAKFYRAKQ